MKCKDARSMFSAFMDDAMTGREMQSISSHLKSCEACRQEFTSLTGTRQLVAGLGRKAAPPDLALKLRVAISREVAQSRRSFRDKLHVHAENLANAFMVPASAGMVSAIIIFGLLIGVLVPSRLTASNDVPSALFTPPELAFSPFGIEMGSINADSLVVEAYVDANGRVQDYRVLSAPEGATANMTELKNMLIFTVFKPATSFGQPTGGRAILTFSKINVKG